LIYSKASAPIGQEVGAYSAMSSMGLSILRTQRRVYSSVSSRSYNTQARELDRAFIEARRDTVPESAQLWCHINKLEVMQKVVELGFELDLYLPSEYIFMYW
jgi:hypothetical protein